jgi:hypothetical protein
MTLSMSVVLGLFDDGDKAVATLEALRAARFDTDKVRLVAGPQHAGDFAANAGAAATVAAGPAAAVVGGLSQALLPPDEQESIQKRLDEGAVLVMADELDDAGAEQLGRILRERGAESVTVSPRT